MDKAGAVAPSRRPSASERKRADTVLDRTLSKKYPDLEYSVHLVPRGLTRELLSVFPGTNLHGLHVIPTFQKSSTELLEFGDEQEKEKNRLLEVFVEWATELRQALHKRDPSAWMDCTDPASGQAYFGTAASPYSDVDGICRVTSYDTRNCGGCTVVRHPDWNFACYPATVFSTADKSVLIEVLNEVNQ